MCKKCNDDNHESVGMDMCIYCGECKGLLIQTRFINGKPAKGVSKYQSSSPEPCDKCKEKFKEQGVFPMIEAERGKNGQPIFGRRVVYINREVLSEEFIAFGNQHGFIICDVEAMDDICKNANQQDA